MRSLITDLGIVLRSVWLNLALFALLLAGAALAMLASGCFPGKDYGELLVKALYMTRIEGAMDGAGAGGLPVALVFALPVLALLILGEGALRVAGLYLNRKRDRGEWEKLMVKSLLGHIVLCGAGELGRALLNRLHDSDPERDIVVVDTHADILADLGLASRRLHSIHGDMTSHDTLTAANVAGSSLIIIASGDDAHNLEAACKALEINPGVHIYIRLYRSGLRKMMNLATYPNLHFFSPYERAADALMEELGAGSRSGDQAEPSA